MSVNRIATVATVSQDGLFAKDDLGYRERFDSTFERMDQAASCRPDVICLPECATGRHYEPLDGPGAQRLSQWAKAHGCYVISGMRIEVGGRKYNSALLFDRKGDLVGRYDKMHLMEGELEEGLCPGQIDPPVFKTDFGVIGMQICFDVNWRDTWARLKEKGAQIVFFPAAFPAAIRMAAYAWLFGYYIVSSTNSRTARIYDITGRTLDGTGQFRQWAWARLPLGKALLEIDYHIQKAREIERKYGPRVEVKWYHEDDWWTLASLDPNLATEEIIEEYDLTPLAPYIRRASGVIDEARKRLGIR